MLCNKEWLHNNSIWKWNNSIYRKRLRFRSKARKWRAKKGTEWEQIGQIQWETKTTFEGTFEGNNHTIIGIYINSTENSIWIFWRANVIQNLTIKDSYIKGIENIGGVVGVILNKIENCHNENTKVIGNKWVGGIIGGTNGRNSKLFK